MTKTFIAIAVLILVAGPAVFSQETVSTSRAYQNFENRLNTPGWNQLSNLYILQDADEFLSVEERGALYNRYYWTSDAKIGMLFLNMLLPGLGNLVFRDYTGALLNFFGTLGCGALFVVSTINATPSFGGYLTVGLTAGGTAFFFLNNLVSSFVYMDSYNYHLGVALKLDKNQRNLYRPKMLPILPIVMNLFPGFGIGSFAQDDVLGGMIGLGLDTGAVLTFLVGFVNWNSAMNFINYPEDYNPEYYTPDIVSFYTEKSQLYMALMITGGVLAIVNRLWGIIRPIWVSIDFNNGYVSAGQTGNSFVLRPYITPSLVKDKIDMRFGFNLEFGI